MVLGKEKLNILVASSIFLILETEEKKKQKKLLLWTLVGGRVGYQAYQDLCYVWYTWCVTSVLSSQVFRQALMESCARSTGV